MSVRLRLEPALMDWEPRRHRWADLRRRNGARIALPRHLRLQNSHKTGDNSMDLSPLLPPPRGSRRLSVRRQTFIAEAGLRQLDGLQVLLHGHLPEAVTAARRTPFVPPPVSRAFQQRDGSRIALDGHLCKIGCRSPPSLFGHLAARGRTASL